MRKHYTSYYSIYTFVKLYSLKVVFFGWISTSLPLVSLKFIYNNLQV